MTEPVPIDRPKALLNAAYQYANLGIRVIPLHNIVDGACSCGRRDCQSPGKHPRIRDWVKDATTKWEQIEAWWKAWPLASIGGATGRASRFVVIDIDSHRGGDDNWETLQQQIGVMGPTATSLTGGGGFHYLFNPADIFIQSSSDRLGVGIDVRGEGGYVVLPPSDHISGKPYLWDLEHDPLSGYPIAPLPAALAARCAAIPRKESAGSPVELTIPQGSRNSTLAKTAGIMRRKGLSYEAIYAALVEENRIKCRPPLDDVEVRNIARSISRYLPGDPILAVPARAEDGGPHFWSFEELDESDFPDPVAFCGPMLTRGEISLVAGRRGVGKTHLTLSMARAIAEGQPFGHMVVQKGRVLYLSQEMSESAMRKRGRALKAGWGGFPADLRVLCKQRLALDTEEGAAEMSALIGDKYDVVFVDALRNIKGGYRENSNDDMGDLLVRLLEVATKCRVAVCLVHHKGKPGADDEDRGGRGASAIEDVPVDVLYLATKKGERARTAKFEKLRDADNSGGDLDFWYEISSGQHAGEIVLAIGRGEAPEPAAARYDPRDAGARERENAILEVAQKVERELKRQLLRDSGGLSKTQLQQLAGGRKATIDAALAGLEAQRVVEGRPGPRNSILWFWTGPR